MTGPILKDREGEEDSDDQGQAKLVKGKVGLKGKLSTQQEERTIIQEEQMLSVPFQQSELNITNMDVEEEETTPEELAAFAKETIVIQVADKKAFAQD